MLLLIFNPLFLSLFMFSGLCSCRLTKAQRASSYSLWRCPVHCSRGSQSLLILRGRTEMWRRSCCRLLRTPTVELLYSKVRNERHMEGHRIEGKTTSAWWWQDRQETKGLNSVVTCVPVISSGFTPVNISFFEHVVSNVHFQNLMNSFHTFLCLPCWF